MYLHFCTRLPYTVHSENSQLHEVLWTYHGGNVLAYFGLLLWSVLLVGPSLPSIALAVDGIWYVLPVR